MRTASDRLTLEEAPDFFGPPALGRILGIAASRAYELAKQEDFPATRIGKKILISKIGLLRWIQSHNLS